MCACVPLQRGSQVQRRVGLLVLRAGVHVHVDAEEEQQALHVLLQDGQVQEVVALVVILQDGRDAWWFNILCIFYFLQNQEGQGKNTEK